MNSKIPQKHESKTPSQVLSVEPLILNRKRPVVVRLLAPVCILPENNWWSRRSKHVVFVIHDSQIKYLEFTGSDKQPFFVDFIDDACFRSYDPGDSIHGGSWKIFFCKSKRRYQAEFQGESRLTKHHRKMIKEFLKYNPDPFGAFCKKEKIENVMPVFKYTEKLIPV